jgi:hypothetical protein
VLFAGKTCRCGRLPLFSHKLLDSWGFAFVWGVVRCCSVRGRESSGFHFRGARCFSRAELASSIVKFRQLFADATCYSAAIPTVVGGHMAIGFASDDRWPRVTAAKTFSARHGMAGGFATKY